MDQTGPILPKNATTSFKQHFGETLRDAWERINKMHSEDPIPCGENNMNLFFYYGLDGWYKNALDRATGGSYILSSPAGSALALKNIFGTYRGNDREIDGIITILNSAKERIENCIKELPEKEDFEHLEHFSKDTLPEIEDKMATIIHKLNICENEFTKDDKQLLSAEKRVAYLGDIFKGAASCKFLPKAKDKKPTLQTTK
jgi:hypothetical protein